LFVGEFVNSISGSSTLIVWFYS